MRSCYMVSLTVPALLAVGGMALAQSPAAPGGPQVAQATIILAPNAPPPPRDEPPPPPPPTMTTSSTTVQVWETGHWTWTGGDWVWMHGQYVARPTTVSSTASWQPGHWIQQPNGWEWVDGHWQYPVIRRCAPGRSGGACDRHHGRKPSCVQNSPCSPCPSS
jgi:hypothetical protein